jgi:phage shock protein C
MICTQCQRDIPDFPSFCSFCGARLQPPPLSAAPAPKRLMRSVTDRKIAGVCGGIAEYFGVDSTFVRLVWVLVIIAPIPLVPAFLGYFVAWLVMPKPVLGAVYTPPAAMPYSTQTT